MPTTRQAKKAYKIKEKMKGRPRRRWNDEIEGYLTQKGLDWRKAEQNKGQI